MSFGELQFKKPEFAQISDVVWDISPGFKQGMRVPARIVATKKLIDAMDLQVYNQITNGAAEEAGFVYKDIDDVVEATALAGISLPVAKLVPFGNIKG
jgi:RNA-splicing ligase RtcB